MDSVTFLFGLACGIILGSLVERATGRIVFSKIRNELAALTDKIVK